MQRLSLLLLVIFAASACSHTPKNEKSEPTAAEKTEAVNSAAAVEASAAPSENPADKSPSAALFQNSKPSEEFKGVPGALICKKGNDERSMKVVPKGDGCELVYKKFGVTKVISWSSYTNNRCEKSRDKIWKELEAAGFICE